MHSQQREPASPLTVFYSYADKDEALLDELETHLSLLQRQGIIAGWHQRKINPGWERAQVINEALHAATIILLLISPDFLASDYCYGSEMQFALDRHEKGLVHVIPILLRPADWQNAPFSHLQCLPSNRQPVTLWENRDAAFVDIVKGIRATAAQNHSPAFQSVFRPLTLANYQNRQRLLKRVRIFWIQGMLEQSLHQATLITLGLQEQPDALDNPWSLVVQETGRPARPLPTGTRITQVYDDSDGELLILGEPGAGKSTLLLELARDLLHRADQDENHLMPVVFNLSSWAVKRLSLADWLAEELNLKYQVPSQLARLWVSVDCILPLLDGLDEVAPTHRATCLDEINSYRGEHNLPFVVCSRSQEYFSQTTRIFLHNAVTVQPLTVQQIDEYLRSAGEQVEALRTVLHSDNVLLSLAMNPLMLNVLTLAYRGKTVEELTISGPPEVRRRQIFAAYIQRLFERRGTITSYTSQQTLHWLSWLASQMALHNQTEFYLESMQPSWLWNKNLRRFYEWTIGRPMVYILCGLFHALYCGMLGVLMVLFLSHAHVEVSGTVLGALVGIFPAGTLVSLVSFIFYGWRKGLYTALVGIPMGGLVGALISVIRPDLQWPMMGLIVGLITGMLIGLFASTIGLVAYTGINAKPVIGWSWKEVQSSFRIKRENKELQTVSVIGGIGIVLVIIISIIEKGVFNGLIIGGSILLAGLLIYGLFGGIRSKTLSKHVLVVPNQGVRLSALKGLYFCLGTGFCAFLGTWLVITDLAGLPMGLICGLVAGSLAGFIQGVVEGWDTFVRHWVLRMLLWRAGSLPRNYTHFLDYAAERILLRKIGGGYIFIHRLLLEYLALLAITEEEAEHLNSERTHINDATVYHNRGLIYAEFSDYQQAIRNYTYAIRLNSKEASFYLDRGRAYTRLKEYQQAINDYTHALDLESKNARTLYERGKAYHNLKEYEKALADYTQAITLGFERAFLYRNRGFAYRDLQEYGKAVKDLTRAIELNPQNVGHYSGRGSIYYDMKDYEKALTDFTQEIELNTQEPWLYHRRALIYHILREHEKALTDFTQAIELSTQASWLYYGRGWVYHTLKEYEKALTDFTQAIELTPQEAHPYGRRGVIFHDLKEYEKALADFTQAIEFASQEAWFYERRGLVYFDLKEHEKALADFTQAIRLNASSYKVYFERGYTYVWLNQREAALADFVKCTEIAPGNTKAAWMSIYVNLSKQRPGLKVVESLEKIVATGLLSAETHLYQGVALGLQNNFSDAIANLEQSIQLEKSMGSAYFWKGLFCAYLGRDDEAKKAITQAFDVGLPPMLFTPLYWLEQERPEFYFSYAVPFLLQHGI